MNRAERRKLGVKNKESVFTMKKSDIDKIKEDATHQSMEIAFKLMLSIPVKVLSENYSKITKLNVDGKSREERFADMCLDLYDSFDKGYVSMDDLMTCLQEETGMSFEEIRK